MGFEKYTEHVCTADFLFGFIGNIQHATESSMAEEAKGGWPSGLACTLDRSMTRHNKPRDLPHLGVSTGPVDTMIGGF